MPPSACLGLTFGVFSLAGTGWFVGPCSLACPHNVTCPLSQQENPCPITSCQVSSLPRSWPLSEWFRTLRTSQPTPKIVVWEATLWEALRNHISATAGLTLRSSQPSLGGSLDPWSPDPSCYRGSEMQSLQTGQAQTRGTGGSHMEEKRPRLQSSDRCFPSPVEMPSQAGIEELCLGVDGHFGAEIHPRFLGSGGRCSEGRERDSSLCLAPHPQFLSSVLWVKMRWEPQKTFFGVGGGNCRWQMYVEHMCNRGCSPASARNDPLSFLSSHVSRSVSPTTTSQIQARKKRRGIIEKRRRDRINSSLSELRRLVPTAFEKQVCVCESPWWPGPTRAAGCGVQPPEGEILQQGCAFLIILTPGSK